MSKKNILICAVVFFLGQFGSMSAGAAEKGNGDKLISLEAVNQKFDIVLQRLTKVSGYSIELKSGLDVEQKTLTFVLTDTGLLSGLKQILKSYSNVIEINDQTHHVLIRLIPDKRVISHVLYAPVNNEDEVVPPGEGEVRGITRTELALLTKERDDGADPMEAEVVPPEKMGEKAITRGELDALNATMPLLDPLAVEVVPPNDKEEGAITRGELDKVQSARIPVDPLDIEVVPPEKPGEKGITRRELEAINAREEKVEVDPLDEEVVPPDNPGEKGLTRRELNLLLEERKRGGN